MKSANLILQIKIAKEEDALQIGQATRQLSALGGLSSQSGDRFAVAVSEIAHNALQHAGGGIASFFLVADDHMYQLEICIADKVPGIKYLDDVLGKNKARTAGQGICCAKKLVHYFDIQSNNTGTQISLSNRLRLDSSISKDKIIENWKKELKNLDCVSAIEVLHRQNQMLISALAEIEESKTKLSKQKSLLKDHSEKADKLKTSFVANMSHEMRTPLNAIIGISDILSKTVLNKHQQFLVNSLDAAGRSLLSLINDILDLSKLAAGKFEIEDIDFSLIETIKEALTVVQPQALEKYVDLLLFCGQFLPDRVQGDPHRLQQVLINIVANAIKFSNQNSETDVFVYSNGSSEKITEVRFVVFDTGIGISLEDHSRLFEAFSQVDASTNRKHGGSGLGLSICRYLVSLMKGEIGFLSQKDIGTAFWFNIPFVCKHPVQAGFRDDLNNLEVIFSEQKLLAFELLLKALGIKTRRLKNLSEIKNLRNTVASNFIFVDDLPTEFASSKPSRLFNHLMERAQLSYRIENFRSGKERFLLGRKTFTKILSNCGNALLVEDHTMNQLIGKLQLEELGFSVDVCSTGTEAIQSVKNKTYSIIFMDCQVPEMDGYEITRRIRILEKDTNKHIPIIALTASSLEGEREKCLNAGMDDYLSKPVEPELLYTTCKKWLENVEVEAEKEIQEIAQDAYQNANIDQSKTFQVIDKQKLLEHFSKDQYLQLVKMFQSDTTTILAELDKYLENKNAEAAIFSAHKLQGASRMIYAKAMADNYRNMEAALRAQMWNTAKEILSEIKNQFNQVKDQLVL